jgi:GntR family histidine utilization transcriptional repressor
LSQTLVQRIRGDLEEAVRSGRWRPGDRIPTEHELMQQYGCARMTVHKAISDLVDRGLIVRRKKAGSFVARPHVQTAVLEIPDIAAVVAARGACYRFDLLERVRREAGTLPEADRQPDMVGDALVLDGMHVADGEPFAFEHRIISLSVAPEAQIADFTREGPGGWLLGHIPWTQARHRISACNAGTALSDRLQIPRGGACLLVERWTWRQAEPVTFVRQWFPAELYELTAEFQPGLSPA